MLAFAAAGPLERIDVKDALLTTDLGGRATGGDQRRYRYGARLSDRLRSMVDPTAPDSKTSRMSADVRGFDGFDGFSVKGGSQ
jgi:hypothetical protein